MQIITIKKYMRSNFFLQNLHAHKMHINLIKYSLPLEDFIQNIQNLK